MPTVRAERLIEADPTSVALLLAGPTAIDFWPGVRRLGGDPALVLAEAVVPTLRSDRPVRVAVRALPPARTPTAYVSRFEFSGDGLPTTTGVLTLTYEPRGGGESATSALLRLDWSARGGEGRWRDRVVAGRALRDMTAGFLDNLATAAEERSRAA